MRVSVIRASLASDYCGVGEATRQADEGSMAARLSKRCRERRQVERRLPAHVEPSALIDELELPDDAADPSHRDIHHLGRPDRAYLPRTTDRERVNGERMIRRRAEPAARSDPSGVDGDRLGPGVPQLVHEIGQRALVERAVDPHRDARAADRAHAREDAKLAQLTLGLSERALATRDRLTRGFGPMA